MDKEQDKFDELAQIMKTGFDQVGEQISTLRTELKAEISDSISGLRTELKADIVGVNNKIDSEISSVRTELGGLRAEMREGFMKTNDKVDLLTVKLADKQVISPKDAKDVMALGPTPAI